MLVNRKVSQTMPAEFVSALVAGHVLTASSLLNDHITLRAVLAPKVLPQTREYVLPLWQQDHQLPEEAFPSLQGVRPFEVALCANKLFIASNSAM